MVPKLNKRINSRGIIIEDDYIYLIFRRKINNNGTIKEYYVIPGGGVNENESYEECVLRELNEELSVNVKIEKYLGLKEDAKSIAHFYKCTILKGEPKLGGEELLKCNKNNYYKIKKTPLKSINNIDLLYIDMIEKAIKTL